MRHCKAIFQKQLKDTLKNMTILIQFFMFPIMTLIMENAVKIDNMPEHFFATLFASMFIGMAPLTSTAAIISEEKEMNTMRMLRFSNVKPFEYLFGVGLYVWLMCMAGAVIIGLASRYTAAELVKFVAVMGVGILVSVVMGAAIGTWSKNQMMSTGITMPVMMVFSFLPMLSMFNETIDKVAKCTYTKQIFTLLNRVENMQIETIQWSVILVNVIITISLFVYAYKKGGLK